MKNLWCKDVERKEDKNTSWVVGRIVTSIISHSPAGQQFKQRSLELLYCIALIGSYILYKLSDLSGAELLLLSKMKGTIFIVFLLTLTLLCDIVSSQGDSSSDGNDPVTTSRSRSRPKVSAAKRKKVVQAASKKVEETTTTTTTVASNDPDDYPVDVSGTVSNGHQDSVEISTTTTSTSAPKTKSKKAPRLIINPSVTRPSDCPECNVDNCPTPSDVTCATGIVPDRCSCCHVCGAGEGNRCYNSTLNLPYNPEVGICGTGMLCLLRSDLEPLEPREALCECIDKRLVCGSDRQTYMSECKLREIAHTRPGLAVESTGACISAPWITTAVDNMTVAIGEDVSMSCEVRGFPPPVIHWEFLPYNLQSGAVILPGDDSSVVIVVRGGPEQMMTTSWIQIISVDNKRQGRYYCIAKNTEGITQSSAVVTVVEFRTVDSKLES